MKAKILGIAVLSLSLALLAGCGVTATVSATDVTQPVMLGKKIRIQGTANEQWKLRAPFDISSSAHRPSAIGGHPSAGSRANPELLKLIETSDDKIVIDEIYIGSYCFLVISPYGLGFEREKSWADIKGGIYVKQTEGHETK